MMAEASKAKGSVLQFFRDVRAEARKVTWATRNETLVSTLFVFIMVAIASLFFFAVDGFFGWAARAIYG